MVEPNYLEKYLKYKKLYLETLKRQQGGVNTRSPISYFFDNDPDNFIDKHLCPNVMHILIQDSEPIHSDGDNEIFVTPNEYLNYCNRLPKSVQPYCIKNERFR